MFRSGFCSVFVFLVVVLATNAQEQDSVSIQEPTVFDTLHSPKKAALYSALLPGAGQVYNHRAMPKRKKNAFWKVPIIYGGLGATAYFAINNHILQRQLKDEYTFRVQNNGATNLAGYEQYDNQGILTLFEQSQRSRDLMIFAFIAVYGLNVVDAHVEAHFVNFDVSKGLSLSISPVMMQPTTPGLSLSLNFR